MRAPKIVKFLGTALAAVLVAGLAAVFLRSPDDTYRVTAYFEKAIGLFENSDVTVLGVAVGKVIAVEPEGRRVKVDMEIEKGRPLPADARAQIVPISVISDRYVQFFPAYTGGDRLADGAVLDTDRTQIPAELDDVFAQLKKLLDAIEPGEAGEPGALGDLIVALDEALAGNEENLRGTITNAAELTRTLARAEEDLSGILVNLDDFFTTLATRSDSIVTLNANLADVLSALAESRSDLEGTVVNLADLTNEVGDLVGTHRAQLGEDIRLAVRLASTILDNERSVRQSLAWLPVVSEGLTRAFHGRDIQAVDIRDNLTAKLKCKTLDGIPESPIKDQLEEACRDETGEPEPKSVAAPALPEIELDCDGAVKKVRRQMRRLRDVRGAGSEVDGLVRRLERKLRRLDGKCRAIERLLDEPATVEGALEQLLEGVGRVPETEEEPPAVGNLQGAASSGVAVPPDTSPGAIGRVGSWVRSFLGFVGWSP